MLTDPTSSSDDDLVREVVAGSHDALAALYDRHINGVFAAARRLVGDRQLAEEVVQETFLALWDRAELFDPRAGSLAAWLRTISRNKAVDRIRAAKRRPLPVSPTRMAHEDESDEAALDRLAAARPSIDGAPTLADPERAVVSRWARERIQHALATMPEDERMVILMAYDRDLSQAEIADRLGWPLGTVKTRTRRALRRLRALLADDFDQQRQETVATHGSR
jgi:RNA polymerase sigma-70 factor (ECF subfamily)